MPYICYVYEREGQVPYMEVLAETTLVDAWVQARKLLSDRPQCRTAELWEDETKVCTLAQDAPAAAE